MLTIVTVGRVLDVQDDNHSESRITRSEIAAHLNQVLAGSGFKSPKRHGELLRYLVDRSLADETPHEVDIAIDVFGRDASYDPAESSSVRVSIHNLRKKLDDYYAEHPPESNLRLTIPKGSYRVSFGSTFIATDSSIGEAAETASRRLSPWAVTAGVLLVCSLAMNAFFSQRLMSGMALGSDPTRPTFAWPDIFEGDEPILIALGDFYFFSDQSRFPDRLHFIRDVGINSTEELRNLGVETYGPAVQGSDMTYLPKAPAFALQSILPAVQQLGKPVSLKLMSEVTGEDLRENDVIYIGFVRSMGALQQYFLDASNFSAEPPFMELRHKDSAETYGYSGTVYGYTQDYGLFSKMPGPGNGELVVFTGIHDIGIMHAVRALTDPARKGDLIEALHSNADTSSKAVEVLFSVSGYNRSDLGATVAIAAPVLPR